MRCRMQELELHQMRLLVLIIPHKKLLAMHFRLWLKGLCVAQPEPQWDDLSRAKDTDFITSKGPGRCAGH